MKKNKKKLIITISIVIALIVGFLIIYCALNLNNENSLTIEENQWLDTNKKNEIDIALINDIPVLSYDGKGLAYDFIEDVSNDLSLDFNIISYKLDGTSSYDYKMDIVDKPNEKDIVLLKDNFILVTKDGISYNHLSEIDNLKLGILSSDKTVFSTIFNGKNIELIEYSSYSELKKSLNSTNETENLDTTDQSNTVDSKVDGIIILKTIFTKEMLENNYKISYQFNDYNKYFVLTMNSLNSLNSILNKKYNIWLEEEYSESYNKNLLNSYFTFKNVSDVDQKNLMSKSYVYGFINYGIYSKLDGNKISGLSGILLKDFNKFSGISITYTRYNSISNLLKDFNANEVDFMLNISSSNKHQTSIYNTVGAFSKDLVIISGINNTLNIENLNSLKDKEVLAIKDSYLENYLIQNGIKVKSYNNMDDLSKDFKITDIAVLDLENYNYYKSSSFKDCKINKLLEINDRYNFIINDSQTNNNFKNIFDFYLNYKNVNELIYEGYSDVAYENSNFMAILIFIIIALSIYLVLDFSNHVKIMIKKLKKNQKIKLSKEDKLKYIDQLTSLKNRAYLNSKIETWDESEIYPQSIIVIDLNNISYVNDNYGREEGDKVITEAANILIMHQLQNSEIIRTDGNEFLIYLVGYNEKQIISYLRRLNKEFKKLSHGFGAASGYSIISDAIKTIDDAINEATLDMKNNKEDIEY